MSPNAYELLALCMRYVFAGIMLLIVFRAWRVTLVDGRRATKLRRLSPETGIVGELLVVDGHDRAKYGMHYPLTLEGTIGSSRGNDIRLRSGSVRRRHAIFQMTPDGLFIRNHAHSRLYDGFGRPLKELTMRDGDFVSIGSVRLMLILSDGDTVPRKVHVPRRYDADRARVQPGISRDGVDLFEVDADGAHPIRSRSEKHMHPQRRRRPPMNTGSNSYIDEFDPDDNDGYDSVDDYDDDDVFFDFDEYDDC